MNKLSEILKNDYRWPEKQKWNNLEVWNLGSKGHKIIIEEIEKSKHQLLLEVGAFTGYSVIKWLEKFPELNVIAIDIWDSKILSEYAKKHNKKEIFDIFKNQNGPLEYFQNCVYKYKDRVFPLKGDSISKMIYLHNIGIKPDIIYLDAEKTSEDIFLIVALFPKAVICGDDWNWVKNRFNFPIRQGAYAAARFKKKKIKIRNNTWLLVDKLTFSDRLYAAYTLLKDIINFLASFFKNA